MRWASVLIVVVLMAGCQSKRNLTVKEHSVEAIQTTASADVTHADSRDTWSKILATLDSLNLTFTADSIKTPEGGVMYNPVIAINAVSPVLSVETNKTESSADSLHAETHETADVCTDIDATDNQDTVAVAKPPSLRVLFAVLTVASLLGLIIYRWIKNR